MTADQPLDPQGRAYTDGWRDYAANQIVGNAGQYRGQYRKFYAKGWADHQRRDQRPAMYARKEHTNERRPA